MEEKEFSIIMPCPECGFVPLANVARCRTGKPFIGCMNILCLNIVNFEGETLDEAIDKWNSWVMNHS